MGNAFNKDLRFLAVMAGALTIISIGPLARAEECRTPQPLDDLTSFSERFKKVSFFSTKSACAKKPDFSKVTATSCGPEAKAAYKYVFDCMDHQEFSKLRGLTDKLLQRSLLKSHFDRNLELLSRFDTALPGMEKEWTRFQQDWQLKLKSTYGIAFTDHSPALMAEERGELQGRVAAIPRIQKSLGSLQRKVAGALGTQHPTAMDLLVAQALLDSFDSAEGSAWAARKISETAEDITPRDFIEREKDVIYSKYPELATDRILRAELRSHLARKPQLTQAVNKVYENGNASRSDVVLSVFKEINTALKQKPPTAEGQLANLEALFLSAHKRVRAELNKTLQANLKDRQGLWRNRDVVLSALADLDNTPAGQVHSKLLREMLGVLYCGATERKAREDRVNKYIYTGGVAVATGFSVAALGTGLIAAGASALALDAIGGSMAAASTTLNAASLLTSAAVFGSGAVKQQMRYNRIRRDFYAGVDREGPASSRIKLEDADSERKSAAFMAAIGILPVKSALRSVNGRTGAADPKSAKATIKSLSQLGFFAGTDVLWLWGTATAEE